MDLNANLNKFPGNSKRRVNKSRADRRRIHLVRLRVLAKYNELSPEEEERIDAADEIQDEMANEKAIKGSDNLLKLLTEFHG